MTEQDLIQQEATLEQAGWKYLGCGNWRDPITDLKYVSSVAFGILSQRKK